ncbi:MAG: quinolinate synthase NadA [Phycisphaerales bacterium]|nr:quinolinate synthase NadA [Phycisphaerales bacterium]
MLWQPELPARYRGAPSAELARWITARREELGSRLLILGHHYQQDDVIQHADFIGDSLKLSQIAAAECAQRGAEFIVFCGVHFMAETADVLTDESVRVILPDLGAGCSMADMAAYEDAVDAWEFINASIGTTPQQSQKYRVIPITYVNSSAAIKAFVGKNGGACCTSSNANQVFAWALAGGDQPKARGEKIKVFFLPDQHLGRNTAHARGLITEVDAVTSKQSAQTALWDPKLPHGGVTAEAVRAVDVILWAGHCSVHKLFRPEHVAVIRARKDGTTIVVHPECAQQVVDLSDLFGSTEFIIKTIENAPAGASFAVATEVHLVTRLARAAAERGVRVEMLSGCQCLCTTMYRIDQQHLAWVLDGLAQGKVFNEIRVHPNAREWARVALDRMLTNAATQKTALVD